MRSSDAKDILMLRDVAELELSPLMPQKGVLAGAPPEGVSKFQRMSVPGRI